jgi:hypothetical protein
MGSINLLRTFLVFIKEGLVRWSSSHQLQKKYIHFYDQMSTEGIGSGQKNGLTPKIISREIDMDQGIWFINFGS